MKILAFDPGLTTGYAALARNGRGLVLEAAGVFEYRQEKTGSELYAIIRAHAPTLIVIEDWEQQGRHPAMHSTWPNRIIGMVEAYASLLGIHLARAGASVWKPQFSARARFMPPLPVKVGARHDEVGRRAILELGMWPRALDAIPPEHLGHAIDAVGLACWVALCERRST